MANTTVLSGLELIKWQRDFMREFVRDTGFSPYMGDDSTNIICVKNDLRTDGYTIRVPLVARLKAAGVQGGTLLGGNEEALDQYFQDVTWDFFRHAVAMNKKEIEKSGPDLLSVVRPLLKEWAAEITKYQIIQTFHTMGSSTTGAATVGLPYSTATAGQRNTFVSNNLDRTLFGTVIANNSSGVFATALATILNDATGQLSTKMLSLAKLIAKIADPHIRPYKNNTYGREYYVLFAHPKGFRDLKNDPVMQNANRDARAREQDAMDKNPLFQDGDLIWDGVIVREIPEFYIARTGGGVNPDTHFTGAGSGGIDVGASFLCGQQALAFVNKQMPRPTVKKEDDYDFITGRGIELAQGMQKLRWNNGAGIAKDLGMVSVYHAAV